MSQSPNHTAVPAERGQCQTIDLTGKLAQIDGHWQSRVVVEMNDYQFDVVKVEGDFLWHRHADTDETFIVLEGELRIDSFPAAAGRVSRAGVGFPHSCRGDAADQASCHPALCRTLRAHLRGGRAHP